MCIGRPFFLYNPIEKWIWLYATRNATIHEKCEKHSDWWWFCAQLALCITDNNMIYNHVQELSLLLMETTSQPTCSLESQLLADHCSIIPAPASAATQAIAVITDRAPDSTITDLHCSLSIVLTINQMDSTVCAAGINGCKMQYWSLNWLMHIVPRIVAEFHYVKLEGQNIRSRGHRH